MPNPQLPCQNKLPSRRNIRLRGFDYSQRGEYFVTVCAHEKRCLFGEIVDGKMSLNWRGEIVKTEWLKTAEIRNEIELGEFVIMPNHFHGIIHIRGDDESRRGDNESRRGDRRSPVQSANGHGRPPVAPTLKPKSLGALVGGFKSAVTKQIAATTWQRGYHEHIVRDEDDYLRILQYVRDNPLKWELDSLHP